MAYGNWNDVIADYEGVYGEHPRTCKHASAMLDLIPKIRNEPALQTLIPFTSHASLCFDTPERKSQIHIWYEDGLYIVDLYGPIMKNKTHEHIEKISVNPDEIVSMLLRYIEDIDSSD